MHGATSSDVTNVRFILNLSLFSVEVILFFVSSYARALDCYPDNMYQSIIEEQFGYVFELGIHFNVEIGIILQVNFVLGM